MLQSATWSEPRDDGDRVHVTATAGPGVPVGGFEFAFSLDDDGRITRFEQDLMPAAPSEPAPLALTDAHAALFTDALSNGTPPIVGYVAADGVPKLSYRATVQVLDEQRLAMWIREPGGGLVRALATNPHVSVFYSDRAHGVTLQFVGRGTSTTPTRCAPPSTTRRRRPNATWTGVGAGSRWSSTSIGSKVVTRRAWCSWPPRAPIEPERDQLGGSEPTGAVAVAAASASVDASTAGRVRGFGVRST